MLENKYENESDIPESYRHLYTEKDGAFSILTGSEIKTIDDVNAVKKATTKEREKSAQLERDLSQYKSLGEVEEVQAKLDKIPSLEAAAEGNLDQEKIDDLADKKAQVLLAPVKRENERLTQDLADRDGRINEFETKDSKRTISDAVRAEAIKQNIRKEAYSTAEMFGHNELEIVDGTVVEKETQLPVEAWLTAKQTGHPYLWPEAQGAGATGSGNAGGVSKNPWSREHWNVTEQGKQMQSDKGKAERLAEAAGTSVNGSMPAAKAS